MYINELRFGTTWVRVNYDIFVLFFGVKHPFKYSEMIIFLSGNMKLNLRSVSGLQVRARCPKLCKCTAERPVCPPGVSAVPDGCGCCKVCAAQLNDDCHEGKPCDHHKGLECNYGNDVASLHGICRGAWAKQLHFWISKTNCINIKYFEIVWVCVYVFIHTHTQINKIYIYIYIFKYI